MYGGIDGIGVSMAALLETDGRKRRRQKAVNGNLAIMSARPARLQVDKVKRQYHRSYLLLLCNSRLLGRMLPEAVTFGLTFM